MKLSIVLSTHAAQFQAVAFKGDFEANVARIASYGYDGVELAIRDPRLVDADQLEATVAGNGLEVPAIGTGQAWGEERLSFTSDDPAVRCAAVERVKSHIPLARRLGAIIILGLIRGMSPPGQSHDRSMAYLVEALQECAASAAGAGVRFALEPLNRYETDLIHTVNDGLDLCYRVVEASIRTAGDRIFHFHVADSNRWHPGGGHLDFGRILGVLWQTGYRGYVSGEFMPVPDADTGARRAIEHLRAVVRELD
jgi:sugar phosphate isomerase/epimerase